MASINDVTPPPPPVVKQGWFSRLKTWQKVLFVLVWPVSGTYGLYWMWKQKRFSQPVRVVLTALFALAIVGYLAFYGSAIGRSPGASTPAASATVAPSQTKASPAPPSATATPEPAKAPADLLAERIRAKLGKSNRPGVAQRLSVFDYERETLTITYAINENLNTDMIAKGAAVDATDILQLTRESGLPMRLLQVKGTYSMVDKLGNAKEGEVINALYSGETLGKINFENFLFQNVWKVSENAEIHPEFALQ